MSNFATFMDIFVKSLMFWHNYID